MNHRQTWIKHHGPITLDENGRPYEVHHIDDITNLKLVTIEEHYDIHYQQGDYGACVLIAKRMKLPPGYISDIQRGKKRPGIGGTKKGAVPWNKDVGGYKVKRVKSTDYTVGILNGRAKLNENDVIDILLEFQKQPPVEGVGVVMQNGIAMSYTRAFAKYYSEKHNVSITAVYHIVIGKSWKNVWKKFKIQD